MDRLIAEIASERIEKLEAEVANLTASSFFIKTQAPFAFGDRVHVKLFNISFPGEVAFVPETGEPGAVIVFDAPPAVLGTITQHRANAEVIGKKRIVVAADHTDPSMEMPYIEDAIEASPILGTADIMNLVPPVLTADVVMMPSESSTRPLSTDDLFPSGFDRADTQPPVDPLDPPTLATAAPDSRAESSPFASEPSSTPLTTADALALAEREIAALSASTELDREAPKTSPNQVPLDLLPPDVRTRARAVASGSAPLGASQMTDSSPGMAQAHPTPPPGAASSARPSPAAPSSPGITPVQRPNPAAASSAGMAPIQRPSPAAASSPGVAPVQRQPSLAPSATAPVRKPSPAPSPPQASVPPARGSSPTPAAPPANAAPPHGASPAPSQAPLRATLPRATSGARPPTGEMTLPGQPLPRSPSRSPEAAAAASALARIASGVGPPRTISGTGSAPPRAASGTRGKSGLPAPSTATLPANKPLEPEPELPELEGDGVTLRYCSIEQFQKQYKTNIAHGGIIARASPIAIGTQQFLGIAVPGKERYTVSARVTFVSDGTIGFMIDSFQVHRDKLKALAG